MSGIMRSISFGRLMKRILDEYRSLGAAGGFVSDMRAGSLETAAPAGVRESAAAGSGRGLDEALRRILPTACGSCSGPLAE